MVLIAFLPQWDRQMASSMENTRRKIASVCTDENMDERSIFMNDNAIPHAARIVSESLDEVGIVGID